MKKILLYIACLFLPLFVITAQGKTHTVQVLKPDLENISSEDSAWLPGQIQDRLKENLQDYAQFITVVDDSKEKQLKALQRKSESSMYDESTAIEAGHITNAAFAVFTTVRKAGSVYTVSLNYMNLKTGTHETVTSSGRKEIEDLFNTAGCAVDELTLRLCEKTGISLSPTQKYVLEHGRSSLSVDEQIAMAKKDSENYEKQLADLDKQIESFSVSTDLRTTDFQKKLEAQKALLQEKQDASERRMKELEEQHKKKFEDAKKEQERSVEVIKQRDDIAKKAETKANAVRNLKMDKETVLGKISVIESKKRALIEIRESVKQRLLEIDEEAESDVLEKTKEIEGRPYRKVELAADGKPTQDALNRRQNQIDTECGKIYARAEENKAKAQAATLKQEDELLKSIHSDYKKIQSGQTVSSLNGELRYTYGIYDGNLRAWPVNLYFYCDGILLTEDKIEVKYSELTGKEAPNLKTAENSVFEKYSNEVDMYDSLLSRGAPVLYYELDYHVIPEPDTKPSSYQFYFDELRVYNTAGGKVISHPELSVKNRERTMTPAYDIRTDEKIAEDMAKENEHNRRVAVKKEKYNHKVAHYSQKNGNGGMTGFYASCGASSTGDFVLDLNAKFKMNPYFFGFVGAGLSAVTEDLKEITDYPGIIYGLAGLGFNWRPFIFTRPPALYVRSGLGIAGFGLEDCHYINSEKNEVDDIVTYLMWQTSAGLEIPLSDRFAVFGEGRYDFFRDGGSNLSLSAGFSIIHL